MAETDHDFLGSQSCLDVGLGLVRGIVAILDFKSHFIGAAMLRAAQGADGPGDGGIHVRTGAGDDPACESRGVEFVFRVEDEGDVHGVHPKLGGR